MLRGGFAELSAHNFAMTHPPVLPSAIRKGCPHSGRDYFAAQYPACMCPCQRCDGSLAAGHALTRGSGWIATPFLCDSFIHNSMPVYPGALRSLYVHCARWVLIMRPKNPAADATAANLVS